MSDREAVNPEVLPLPVPLFGYFWYQWYPELAEGPERPQASQAVPGWRAQNPELPFGPKSKGLRGCLLDGQSQKGSNKLNITVSIGGPHELASRLSARQSQHGSQIQAHQLWAARASKKVNRAPSPLIEALRGVCICLCAYLYLSSYLSFDLLVSKFPSIPLPVYLSACIICMYACMHACMYMYVCMYVF